MNASEGKRWCLQGLPGMRPCARGPEDIPLLARHFVHTYAQRLRTRIDTIPADVLDALAGYPWPGNLRIGSGAAGGGAAEGLKAAAGTWLRARQQVEEHE